VETQNPAWLPYWEHSRWRQDTSGQKADGTCGTDGKAVV